jgi:hypothetical protein
MPLSSLGPFSVPVVHNVLTIRLTAYPGIQVEGDSSLLHEASEQWAEGKITTHREACCVDTPTSQMPEEPER